MTFAPPSAATLSPFLPMRRHRVHLMDRNISDRDARRALVSGALEVLHEVEGGCLTKV